MSDIEYRLNALGIELPPPKTPVANYLGCKRSGDLLFISARVSELQGEVGSSVTEEEAYQAAKETMISILAIIKEDIDLDQIVSVDKLLGLVRSSSDFIRQPQVIDGASDLLVEIFGEAGRHARTATGVAQLPFGACVQLELIMRLRPEG
ncbi:MAG: RidA family protein [Cyclobacteriaceae bacterium]